MNGGMKDGRPTPIRPFASGEAAAAEPVEINREKCNYRQEGGLSSEALLLSESPL